MIKYCIIKSKGDTIVCLLSEVEKPEGEQYFEEHQIGFDEVEQVFNESLYQLDLKAFNESLKEYPIRDEDKSSIINYLHEINGTKSFEIKLSNGISIDPSLVEIKWIDPCGIIQSGSDTVDCIQYATLKPTVKESLQVESNAIEFGDYLLKIDAKKHSDTEWKIITWRNISGTSVTIKYFTTSELYQTFLKTKTK